MNKITFTNQTLYDINEINTMKDLIEYAVKKEEINNAIFSVVFVDNKTIQDLNKKYRSIDKPTDVLSFALEDNDDFINMDVRLLGDIYISVEKAYEQAQAYNHSNLRELSFLMIHGFLHLLGYDHMKKEDEVIMFKRQEELLNEYGIKK